MLEQGRRVVACLRDEEPGHVILSGDSSEELKRVVRDKINIRSTILNEQQSMEIEF